MIVRALRFAILALAGSWWAMSPSVAAVPQSPEAALALSSWESVLQRFVDEQGRVDFQGIADDPADIDEYLEFVAKNGPLSMPGNYPSREHRLAYYINAYNALAMRKVIDFDIPKAITGFRKIRFFGLSRIDVSGESMSLYSMENDYIRGEGDSRIHFALNCMAASCPRLPRTPFLPETLDQRLDELAREFFGDSRHLQVDHANKIVTVSEILDFFTEDFLAEANSLIDYVNRYVEPGIPSDYSVEFFDYDWSVNAQGRD